MRSNILFIFCCFIFSISYSQTHTIKGKIVTDDIQKPVANAAVYLSNTSVGTTTNDKGEFTLKFSLSGRFDLIVSSLGYETYVQNIQSNNLPEKLIITLKNKINYLGNIEVRTYDKEGWLKWGNIFVENFIGTSSYANNCTIKNPNTIRFHFSEKKNELIAFSNEPIIIYNKSLGYIIHYKLEEFRINFNSKFLLYTGYPLFEEMTSDNNKTKNNWKKKREEVYFGSMMHFIRSLFKDQLNKEGFEVRALKKVTDDEITRLHFLFEKLKNKANQIVVPDKDSLAYYQAVISNPNETEIVLPTLKNRNDLLSSSTTDTTFKLLSFTDLLEINYLKKDIPNEYVKYLANKIEMSTQKSKIGLLNAKYVKLYSNGSYFPPQDLIAEGFWSWWEKIATMLSFDYEP